MLSSSTTPGPPVRFVITMILADVRAAIQIYLHLYIYVPSVIQALALLALALMAETGGGYGDDETSNSVGWVMVVLVAGYIVAALVALVAKWDSPTKVRQGAVNTRVRSTWSIK